MPNEDKKSGRPAPTTGGASGRNHSRVEGHVSLEGPESLPQDVKLKAYVFDRAGQTLGDADLDAKGNFLVPVETTQPMDVQVVVGPEGDPQTIRKSAAFSQNYSAKDWKGEAGKLS